MTTATSSTLESINPATGQPIGSVPVTPVGEIDAVVARAREAQKAWGALSTAERVEML
ncbi:MAG TPA: aldehyde dehydrogenase, partial [Phycisphaerales bacterium]|nr:aldehyde dehydrogenase [Phycisphaerales bacterium]